MSSAAAPAFFTESIVFLSAAVIAVPIAKRLGVGSIIGYLFAGMVIGPFGLSFIQSVDAIRPVAELGVVLLLFVLGLELKPERLWRMKSDIFGLGTSQIILTGLALAGVMTLLGLPKPLPLIGGFGMALSSTAFAVQILNERGHFSSAYGQRAFGILLMQDIAIVPLLAMVDIMAPTAHEAAPESIIEQIGITVAAVLVVIIVGRYFLSTVFTILSNTKAREIMLAAALLVALGSAEIMHLAGLSMALGAFLAGIMLAESSFRHALEADIYPFRSLLMGLFFMTVGMTLDLPVTLSNLPIILVGVVAVMMIKGTILWLLAKVTGSPNVDAIQIAIALPQAGEFTFVLFAAAAAAGLQRPEFTIMSAVVILSMVMTPLVVKGHDALAAYLHSRHPDDPEPEIAKFSDNKPQVVVIGFGRFGMVVSQMLMAEGLNIVAIDNNARRIATARKLGLPVYYGDATREDILRASGAEDAIIIALCVENEQVMARAIDVVKENFPKAAIYCRATDRAHAMELAQRQVDYHIRETFESGITFGRAALDHLGISTDRVQDIEVDVREQDFERLVQQANIDGVEGKHLHRVTPHKPPASNSTPDKS
ncbi:monovalent cation:proton antiporter-2 (CPA2) family protein [Cohaesibacter celericrescens]|uniref:Potassium transporter TrkA n=1 Tax=Cohaesibacter celericrescens TaxID=2067669 RepID=A0A2N5XVX9_9HYPH|nr:monovalent cation:proton antiporter-2 (CPA2) family protein [Cohaesibacter celericrescens]PLW78672.1 potassium transporter TrkA [Cohaesibacter celericrescens]